MGKGCPYSATERGCSLTEAVALEPSQGPTCHECRLGWAVAQSPLQGLGTAPKGNLPRQWADTLHSSPTTLMRSAFLPSSPSPLTTACHSPGLSPGEGGGCAPGLPCASAPPPHTLCFHCCPRTERGTALPLFCPLRAVTTPQVFSSPWEGDSEGDLAGLAPAESGPGGFVTAAAAAGGATDTGGSAVAPRPPQGRGHTPPPLRRAVPVNSGRKGTGGRSAVTHSPGIRSPSPAPARFNVPPAVSRSAAPAPTPRPRRDRDPSVCPGTQGEGAAAGRRRTPTSWCAGSGPARSRAGPPSRLPAAVPSEAACAAAVPPNGAPRRHLRSRGTRRRARTPRASERPAAERRPKPLPPRRTQLRAAPAPPSNFHRFPPRPEPHAQADGTPRTRVGAAPLPPRDPAHPRRAPPARYLLLGQARLGWALPLGGAAAHGAAAAPPPARGCLRRGPAAGGRERGRAGRGRAGGHTALGVGRGDAGWDGAGDGRWGSGAEPGARDAGRGWRTKGCGVGREVRYMARTAGARTLGLGREVGYVAREAGDSAGDTGRKAGSTVLSTRHAGRGTRSTGLGDGTWNRKSDRAGTRPGRRDNGWLWGSEWDTASVSHRVPSPCGVALVWGGGSPWGGARSPRLTQP